MAAKCSWCGKQIGFLDITYTYEKVGDKEHCICSECSGKVSAAKNGNITFREIKTDRTAPELFKHLVEQVTPTDEMLQARKVKQEQEQIKDDARQINPLYDDIHQIAGDLRFIKNYLIFSIVAGIILGFLLLAAML